MVASAAWREPTCLCASPLRERMKTSHNGILGSVIVFPRMTVLRSRSALRLAWSGCPLPPLRRIGHRRFANPAAGRVRVPARLQPLAVARTVAGEHLAEFVPVDLAELPMPGRLVEL